MSDYATKSTPKRIAIDPACKDDPFYRYQMRQLQLNVVGKGKMVRTFITNVDDVASDLKIPPSYLINYLGQKIGAQSSYDDTRQKGQRAFLSGGQSVEQVSETVEKFLFGFILCGQCVLPELLIKSTEKSTIYVLCQSCGWKKRLDDMKLGEKFCKFVSTHPPTSKSLQKKKSEKTVQTIATPDVDQDESEGDWFSDLSAEAVAQRATEMLPTQALQNVFQSKNI